MKLMNNLDLNKLELRNAAIQVLATAPSAPVVGQTYFDSVSLMTKVWNGSAWVNKASDSLLLNGQAASFYNARANHTGTQLSATISDLASTVQAYRIDQFAAAAAAISLGGFKITNLADPTVGSDASTKNYVDTAVQSAAAGIDSKPSVRVIATSNISLTGLQSIDGVSVAAGDRVLVIGQTTAAQNGVYIAASTGWSRALDADQTGEITPGAFWFVEEGTTNAKTQWRCNNTGTITIGTTSIAIVQFGAANMYSASNGIALTGTNFTAVTPANSGIIVDATGISLDKTVTAGKYSTTIGDGSATSFTVTHNLNTTDVTVAVKELSSSALVIVDIVITNSNSVTIAFGSAPTASSFRVTVIG